jgi:hypothetical protein
MRAIVISGGVLAIAAVFGLGVVVGRFVLTRDVPPVVSAPTNEMLGTTGLDNPVGDPNAVLSGDPSLNALPPAPAAPLPPALPPGYATTSPTTPTQSAAITARDASVGAMEAASVTASCNIRVSRDAPIRSWTQKDRISVSAIGDTCGASVIRISLETPTGASLYSLQASARDFGISPEATAEDVRDRINQILPTDAVRAAAYPPWSIGGPPPATSEFTRDAYEAVRAANAPVTCVLMPSAPQRCLATDPTNGQIKVFARG